MKQKLIKTKKRRFRLKAAVKEPQEKDQQEKETKAKLMVRRTVRDKYGL